MNGTQQRIRWIVVGDRRVAIVDRVAYLTLLCEASSEDVQSGSQEGDLERPGTPSEDEITKVHPYYETEE